MDGKCSGLAFSDNQCFVGPRGQDVDPLVCPSVFAAGFRTEGQVGCETGSMCAEFLGVEKKLNDLYLLNLFDTVLELFSFAITVTYIITDYMGLYKTSMLFNRFNVYVLMYFDVILQVAVLCITSGRSSENNPNMAKVLEIVNSATCWSLMTPARDLMNDTISSLEWVNILGWMELGVVLLGLGSAMHDRFKQDKEDTDTATPSFKRIGLVVSLLAIFFDVLLSSIDFFKFTIESHENFKTLIDSLSEYEEAQIEEGQFDPYSGWDSECPQCVRPTLQKCIIATEIFNPVQVEPTLEGGCVESNIRGMTGTPAWGVAMLNLALLWLGFIAVIIYRHKNNLSQGKGGGSGSTPLTLADIKEELSRTKEQNRERQLSVDRVKAELAAKEAELKEQKAEIERMKKLYGVKQSHEQKAKIKEKEKVAERLSSDVERKSDQLNIEMKEMTKEEGRLVCKEEGSMV